MNNRTETITYRDKKGRIVMQSSNDWHRDREDKATVIFFAGAALFVWVVAAVLS